MQSTQAIDRLLFAAAIPTATPPELDDIFHQLDTAARTHLLLALDAWALAPEQSAAAVLALAEYMQRRIVY